MKSDDIIGAVQGVTKKWAKQRKAEERHANAEANRRFVLTRSRYTIKDAAWDVMEDAYLKASGVAPYLLMPDRCCMPRVLPSKSEPGKL